MKYEIIYSRDEYKQSLIKKYLKYFFKTPKIKYFLSVFKLILGDPMKKSFSALFLSMLILTLSACGKKK